MPKDLHRWRRLRAWWSVPTIATAWSIGSAAALAEERPGESSRVAGHDEPSALDEETWYERESLTGQWGGARTWLEKHGLTISLIATGEGDRVFTGGLGPADDSRLLVDAGATVDLERSVGWRGASFGTDVSLFSGDYGQPVTGAYQEFSNIDADRDGVFLSSAWFEQWFADDIVGVKLGRITGSDFDATPAAADLLDTSAIASPTVYALPGYPTPAPMAEVIVQPGWGVGATLGVAHAGANDDIRVRRVRRRGVVTRQDSGPNELFIGEVEYEWLGIAGTTAPGRIAVGGYHHVENLVRFEGGTQAAADGFYATAQQQVLRRRTDDDDHGLFVFVQFGTADKRIADVDRHQGVGATFAGPTTRRDDDSCGVYVSAVRFTDERRSTYDGRFEVAYEVFYRIAVTGWCAVQPDLQFFANPDDRPKRHDAVVGTLRTRVAF